MRKKLLTGAVAAMILSAGYLMVSFAADGQDVISQGVYIGDKDVSGMTSEEAEAYVKSEEEALGSSVITLQMGDDQISKTWKELGLRWENTDLIQEISEIGTTGNIIRRYKEQKDLKNKSSKFEIEYSMDEDAEKAFVEACAAFNSDPVEGSVYMGDDGMLYVEGGTDGLTLDSEATLVSLKNICPSCSRAIR